MPPSRQGRSKVLLGPEIFVLELQVMLSKNRKIFFLENPRPIMLGLVFDVIDGFWHVRHAYAESAITVLPREIMKVFESIVYPS